jgi:helicase required for RNAi-mediated heterochromatin assembly 1
LVSGSIVALTPAKDNFKSKCVVAIVAARPKAGVECIPPEIDIYFSCPEDIEIDPQVEWLMVEAKKGYYEAFRHTMRALQKLQGERYVFNSSVLLQC